MTMRTVLGSVLGTGLVAVAANAAALAPASAAPTPHAGQPSGQHSGQHRHHAARPYSFAVIGDIPYGDAQVRTFPAWIQEINAAKPAMTFHVGDIKNGSTPCDDATYTRIRSQFDTFVNPLIYTPGDNEWTDCHRPNNGAYQPLERLAFDRSVFFRRPGRTLGQHPTRVKVADRAHPENVRLRRARVDFATLHVVGSNDDLQPWTGIGQTQATPEQVAEEHARLGSAIRSMHRTFRTARAHHDRAVMLLQQADMFDPTYTPTENDISAFRPLVRALAAESRRFRGDVYLVNGDSHVYNADQPLAGGSPWLATYGARPADNLRRITVDGSSNNQDWLRVTVNPRRAAQTLSWTRVPYVTPAG